MTIATDNLSVASRSAQEGRNAANWLYRLQNCLAEQDVSRFQKALRRSGIRPDDIDRVENIQRTQLDQVSRVIRAEVPDISLRMGSIAELMDQGLIGYAAVNSGSLGRALELLYQYHSRTTDRYSNQLERVGDVAVVMAIGGIYQRQGLQNIVEDCFAASWRSLQILLGPVFDPGEIHLYFQHTAPGYVDTYQSVFSGAQLNFDSDQSEFRFPARWLDIALGQAIEGVEEVYTAICERVLGPGYMSMDPVKQVRRLLLSRPGPKMYRLEGAAEQLHMSRAQLRKRLYRAGTCFKTLVLETRMELAKHYLLDTHLSAREIAHLLDYSQPAPFYRAFKQYCEISPEQFRQQNLSASDLSMANSQFTPLWEGETDRDNASSTGSR